MKIMPFLILISLVFGWSFLFTTYYLTCKSYEHFDNAQTRMTFPFNCEVSLNGEEYQNKNW